VNLIHIVLVLFADLLMIAMVLLVFVNVILRYVFSIGIVWSEEVSLLFLVWFIFISFGLGIKQNLHITINVFSREKISAKFNRVLDTISNIIIIFIGVIMTVYGGILVQFTMRSIMPATHMPAGVLYGVVPFAGLSIIIEAVLHIFKLDDYNGKVDSYLFGGNGKIRDIFGGKHA
jgi:TRAP-type C4-dicarboxylate transport system permease small subunit